jgi:hypothetical protein
LYTWAAQLGRGIFQLDIFHSHWFKGTMVPFSPPTKVSSVSTMGAEGPGDCGPDVVIVEEVDGVGEKWSGNTTTGTVETILEAFLKGFQTWDSFTQLLKYQNFWSISTRIKEIILYFTNCSILISPQHMYFKAL